MSESSLTSCVCFSVSVREKEKAKRYHDVSTQTTMNRKFVKIRSFILSSFCHLCSHRAKCVTFARSIIQLQFMTIYNQIDVQMAWALPGLRSSSFPCNLKNELPSRSFHLLLCPKLKVLTYLGSTKNFTSDEFKILKCTDLHLRVATLQSFCAWKKTALKPPEYVGQWIWSCSHFCLTNYRK